MARDRRRYAAGGRGNGEGIQRELPATLNFLHALLLSLLSRTPAPVLSLILDTDPHSTALRPRYATPATDLRYAATRLLLSLLSLLSLLLPPPPPRSPALPPALLPPRSLLPPLPLPLPPLPHPPPPSLGPPSPPCASP
eukprot:3514666-Rhodomonas_salina.1